MSWAVGMEVVFVWKKCRSCARPDAWPCARSRAEIGRVMMSCVHWAVSWEVGLDTGSVVCSVVGLFVGVFVGLFVGLFVGSAVCWGGLHAGNRPCAGTDRALGPAVSFFIRSVVGLAVVDLAVGSVVCSAWCLAVCSVVTWDQPCDDVGRALGRELGSGLG